MQSAVGGVAESRPLFGGALSAVIPRGARDASELREIPNNQEVFAHEATDQSLIVELVEYQGHVADRDAARYHFEDIAGSNNASEPGAFEVASVVRMPESELSLLACDSAWTLTGTQCVSKFNEEARNAVTLHLGVFRLPQFSTEVLVSFNDPQRISPESSSSINISSSISSSSSSSSSSSAASGETHSDPWTMQDFRRLLQTLTLHNPGLFA